MYKDIYRVVKSIPKGKVLTYRIIADVLKIKDIRLIGFALHKNKNPDKIPCYRVIKSDGIIAAGFAFGGRKQQMELLKQDGVAFVDGNKVNLKRALWNIPKWLEVKFFFLSLFGKIFPKFD